ncbi:hypothetical protein [Paenibacillus sp. PK3_47]|uniref:hypothetical protein n=1 Tax=Paenibacillus sp. PK3_47 TaxID=2072642 RepID=UPI00201D45FF|nr:hypothetical protein [Paenibacillus sp. PK3_47]
MDKQPKQAADKKTVKKVETTYPSGKIESEFAEELTSSDIESAFKNPVTGEERMY